MSKPQKKRSPYQRYEKSPYLYSAELRAWRRATIERDGKAADFHAEAWHRRQGWWSRTTLTIEPRPPRRHVFPPGVVPFGKKRREEWDLDA